MQQNKPVIGLVFTSDASGSSLCQVKTNVHTGISTLPFCSNAQAQGIWNECLIRPCHNAATLSLETKKALFYHAKPHPHGFHCEARRGKTKLFWSPGTIWPPWENGELARRSKFLCVMPYFVYTRHKANATSSSARRGQILILVPVFVFASRLFSRWNEDFCLCRLAPLVKTRLQWLPSRKTLSQFCSPRGQSWSAYCSLTKKLTIWKENSIRMFDLSLKSSIFSDKTRETRSPRKSLTYR